MSYAAANFDTPVTDEGIRAGALQFVGKISGLQKPSGANEERLQGSTRMRDEEAVRRKTRSAARFAN